MKMELCGRSLDLDLVDIRHSSSKMELAKDMVIEDHFFTLPIDNDMDLISAYSTLILNYYLLKNPNIGYKEFDTSALNKIRLNSDFLNIDNLDQFTNCNLNTCDILILDYYLNSISLLDYFSDTKISEATHSAMFIISGKTIDKSKLPERLRQSTAILKPFKPEEVLETSLLVALIDALLAESELLKLPIVLLSHRAASPKIYR